MSIAAHLGEALKLLRTRRGWPQKQVAAMAGITRGMVSSYEKGKQTPTLVTLEKILKALEADLCDLYCAFEYVTGGQRPGHDLSPRFHLGQATAPRAAARKRSNTDAANAKGGEPGDDSKDTPELSAELERALSDAMAGVHQLLRQVLQHRKPR
jgi:transcriptional regulator with XRE-family HTH domain